MNERIITKGWYGFKSTLKKVDPVSRDAFFAGAELVMNMVILATQAEDKEKGAFRDTFNHILLDLAMEKKR